MRDGVNLARLGIPAVALVTEDFWPWELCGSVTGNARHTQGAVTHPLAGTGEENLRRVAGETVRMYCKAGSMTELLSAADEAAALEGFARQRSNGRLPVDVQHPSG